MHFEEEDGLGGSVENYYACKLLGLISTDGNSCEAVIQCSIQHTMDKSGDEYACEVHLGNRS